MSIRTQSKIFYYFQLSQHQPEGAEIKIPGVGSTPIAVSTQLPAAVAQLTQKGELQIFITLFFFGGKGALMKNIIVHVMS